LFAIFNPDLAPPPGGFCVSVFVVARKKREPSSILVGKIAKPEFWDERWGLSLTHPERWRDKWQIPAAFLKIGEHPEKTAMNICREQVGMSNQIVLANPRFFTSGGASSVRPGTTHEDLFFVYDVEVDEELKKPEHFSAFEFVEASKLPSMTFGRGHDEVLRLCKVL
jgi:ADP-ribose pyrophosphatase YjhB (NUDIX family)